MRGADNDNHRREFESVRGVEIGVADAAVYRSVSETKIGEAGRIVHAQAGTRS
jgi:hypothetical protein